MDSAVDSPAIALFNTPLAKQQSSRHSARYFVNRSLQNIRQGNLTLLVVFAGCLVIFTRALCGAGYDEGLSAHADAANAKHPALLSRWSPSHHQIEEQWNKLLDKRSDSSGGLWAKIRKEDERAGSPASSSVPGSDALHWFRVMENKVGLGRKQQRDVAQPKGNGEGAQMPITTPEHDISEDLDEHDAHDPDDEATGRSHPDRHGHVLPPPPPAGAVVQKAPPVTTGGDSSAGSSDADAKSIQASLDPEEKIASAKPTEKPAKDAQTPTDKSGAHGHREDEDEKEDPDDLPVYDHKQ